MSQEGGFKSRTGGPPVPTQQASWREQFNAATEELLEAHQQIDSLSQEKEDLESRLSEIADIAAPERAVADERLDWIEEGLATLLKLLAGSPVAENDPALKAVLEKRPARS